ncbi:MAG TPA: S8 family serine peptidase [Jiangellales bacterium]|nr:S8 family serine peptidase [Jiangellales bacterium]
MTARSRMMGATLSALALVGFLAAPATAGNQRADAVPIAAEQQICSEVFGGVFEAPSSEPLAQCQWDMSIIHADAATRARATGAGVRVGILDSGVDIGHPDIAPNLDLAGSCSFVRSDDPTIVAGITDPVEAGNGICSNKAAVQDLGGHGTHVASTAAAPINGIGIAGVAPRATIVALKACTASTYCYGYAVAAALRYAGDHDIDVVNMSLFADPYLFYCGNDAGQRAMMRELQSAARYAQQHGVLLVTTTGNQSIDLKHPIEDSISPDGPQDVPITRSVGNNCRVLPAELPGAVTVSATGPVGYPGYTMNIAEYSSVGGDIAAPGGDYFSASDTVQDAVLAAMPANSSIFQSLDPLNADFPGITTGTGAATYAWINGTSMAAPHVTGVAALVKQLHPTWSPGAVAAAVRRTATPMSCPPDWEPLGPGDERFRCKGGAAGHTSFFGSGLVNAAAATS